MFYAVIKFCQLSIRLHLRHKYAIMDKSLLIACIRKWEKRHCMHKLCRHLINSIKICNQRFGNSIKLLSKKLNAI